MNVDWLNLVWKILLYFGPGIAGAIGGWLLRRLRANHVIGIVAIVLGEVGLALTVALTYVWVALVIPPNVAIASHLSIFNALSLYAGLVAAAVSFSVIGASSILSTCFGIIRLAPYSRFANILRRYVFRQSLRRRFPGASVV